MLKKNKLHHRWITFVVIFQLVFIWCFPLSVNAIVFPAKPLDYKTLDYTYKEGPLYNTVIVPLSSDYFTIEAYTVSNTLVSRYQGIQAMTFEMQAGSRYNVFLYPVSNYGLLLEDIPEGSYIAFDLMVNWTSPENWYVPTWAKRSYYSNINNGPIAPITTKSINADFDEMINVTFDLDDYPDGAVAFVPSVKLSNLGTALASGSSKFQVILTNVRLVMDISTGYWEQWEVEQTGQQISDATDSITGAIGDMGSDIVDSVGNAGSDIVDSVGNAGSAIVGSVDDMSIAMQESMYEVGSKIDQSADLFISGNEYTDNLADESNEEISAAAGNLEGLGNQLSAIPKPDFSSFKFGIGDLVGDTASVDLLTAPILEIWESPVALGMLTVVITLVIVSWVFFGKK